MSLHIVKSFSRPLALISAALLLHIGGAVAADPAGDVQQQMRELLAGRVVIQSAPPYELHADSAGRPTADAQERARRLLLGVTGVRIQGTRAMTQSEGVVAPGVFALRKGSRAHEDVQAQARRLLLGQRNAVASES